MWETRISWVRLAYLAVILASAAARFDKCNVKYNGRILDSNDFDFGINLPMFSDTSLPGFIVGTLESENMTSVVVNPSNGFEKYVTITSDETDVIDIFLTETFLQFEMLEDSTRSFDVLVFFTCDTQSDDLPLRFFIDFSNNNDPVFEKQNNANGNGYEYSLPMPFPRGVSITAAYNQILVFDVDILSDGETSITFTIQNDLTDSFEVFVNEDYSVIPPDEVKKRFFADLKAKKQLDFTESVDLIIVATDNEDPLRSTSAPIRIEIDVQNSDPLPSFFDSTIYSSEIIVNQMEIGPLETHTPIKLLDAPADATIEGKIVDAPGQEPVPSDLFSISYDAPSSTFQLNLNRVLEGEELLRDVMVMQLEASVVENVFKAVTIIHVDIVNSNAAALQFDSTIYTGEVSDPPETGVVETNQPIKLIGPSPTGDVIVELGPAPPSSGEFISDLFNVQYMPGTSEVMINLIRIPSDEELNQYEVLVMTLTATLVENPLTTAVTIIQVDLPSLMDVPTVSGTFDSILYLSQIDDVTSAPIELTTHKKISIIDPPEGDIVVILQKAPGDSPFYDNLFSVDYKFTEDSNEVILKLERPLNSEELDNEVLLLQLKATHSSSPNFASYTLIQVNLPETEDPPPPGLPGQFDSTLYFGTIVDPEITGEIAMHQKILITEPPSANVQVELVAAPGNLIFYPGLFGVTYGEAEANEVVVSLLRPLNEAEQENEVLVMKLVAQDTEYITDTIIHVDVPKMIESPPGNFKSILYVAEITDPEMDPGVISTHEIITIANAPSGDVTVELSQAPGGEPSYESFFEVTYSESTKSVELRLKTILSEEAQENAYLIMLLKASQDGNDEFNTETIIHIELPIPESYICTTLFPTEPPICPTCPPCLPPTTEAPSTIEIINDPYISTVEAGQTNVILFTIEAKLTGATGTIIYDIETDDENLINAIMVNPTSGEVTLKAELAPGHYTFKVTAQLEGTEDIATAGALLDVMSIATCEDGITCFPYALITIITPEATADENILPGDANPSDPSCKYSIYEQQPSLPGWFSINTDTGALAVSAAADYDDPQFAEATPVVLLKLQVTCGADARFGQPRLQEQMTNRQQMLVVVTLIPKNDEFSPVFKQSEIPVGYPVKSLARQLLPGPITVLEATDQDVGDTVSYALNTANEKFYVNPENGHMYPVDGKYDYKDTEVQVLALDTEGQRTLATVQIRHFNENEIASIAIGGATLEDVDTVLTQLNEKLPHTWGAIKSAVIAEDLVDTSSRRIKRSNKADRTGGLVMMVYALDEDDKKAKKYSVLESLLEDVELEGGWSVSSVQTWEHAAGLETGGGEGTTSDSGLTVAVITLGVLVGVLIITIGLILYITVFRKKYLEKMRAKSGFKNRTSFSREGGLTVEHGMQNGNLHPDWKEGKHDEDDHDDRRKSMVTFSDEPEVIPVETARL